MSTGALYVHEPMTRGKVVLDTTYGPIDIELWPKECPLACRNFVQLCLEGYYDGCIFHRVIKEFMAQTGDPTNQGDGGESIYGAEFKDEIHQRLRFQHRGLIAMASTGQPNTNGSQFFLTLAECTWLDKKHTIFGKITGNSIYNAMKLNELECNQDDRPLYPPKINATEVLWNPFDDIVPRTLKLRSNEGARRDSGAKDALPKEKKLNLLSFGEEAEDEEKELAPVKKKIKSAHDVLSTDSRLVHESAQQQAASALADDEGGEARMRAKLMGKKAQSDSDDDSDDDSSDDDGAGDAQRTEKQRREALEFDKKMRDKLLLRSQPQATLEDLADTRDKERDARKREMKALAKDVKAISRRIDSSAKADPADGTKAASLAKASAKDLGLQSAMEARRAKYAKPRRLKAADRQEETLRKLNAFQESLVKEKVRAEMTPRPKTVPEAASRAAPAASAEDEDDDSGWVNAQLSFEKDRRAQQEREMNKAYANYESFDPRAGVEFVGARAKDGTLTRKTEYTADPKLAGKKETKKVETSVTW